PCCPPGSGPHPHLRPFPTRRSSDLFIMMGGHHAVSGAAAWLAVTGSATIGDRALGAGVLDLTGPEVLAGTVVAAGAALLPDIDQDRKSTRLNSSHVSISYAGFCLKQ